MNISSFAGPASPFRLFACAALACLAGLSFAAIAHEGHDGPAAGPAAQGLAPRAAAHSSDFELVAVPQGGKLVVYLDRFATNEPVDGATIEIESGPSKASAVAAGDGRYVADAPWLAMPGRYALIFTVHARDVSDLLDASLEVPAVAAAAERRQENGWPRSRLVAAGAAALALVLLVMFAARRARGPGRK